MTEESRKPRPTAERPGRKCPICGKPAADAAYPFCSRGCANIDLNRWLSGRYVIPAAEEEAVGSDDAEE